VIKGDIFSALGLKIQGGIRQENDDGSVRMIAEITKVTPGSIADNCGQLQIGDQVLEWNGQKLANLNSTEVYRIISQNSMQSPDIHMIVKRLIRYPTLSSNEQSLTTPPTSTRTSQEHDTNTKKNKSNLRLQLSFQYNALEREFHVIVHGAQDLHLQQGSFACQLSMQYGRDSLSKEQKCTKPQSCSSGVCTWNQRLTFFYIDTLDNLSIWIKLVDLDRNQEILGEICIPLNDKKLNLNGTPEWYYLTSSSRSKDLLRSDSDISEIEQQGSSFNRVLPTINTHNELLPSMIDTTPTSNRKRQLPNIPAAQLHANREKVSQDLIQKATQLKLRLHMQQQQRSFNENNLNEKRQMYEDRIQIFNNEAKRAINPNPSSASQRTSFQSSKSIDTDSPHLHQIPLSTKNYESMTNLTPKMPANSGLKEKTLSRPKIPIIRDKSAPNTPYLNPALSRRTTSAGQHRVDLEKAKLKSFEEKYRKNTKKREPSETAGDDVDSDGSELSTVSKISSVSMLSTQSERPRTTRKLGHQTRMHEHHHFHREGEVQLNEEELRQMAMRTHDTITHPLPTAKTESITQPSSSSSIPVEKTTNPSGTAKVDPRNDGTLSDSVLSTQPESNKKRRPSMSSKALVILGLSKKTNSTSNLGYGKRFGFQRSEEIGVQPHLRSRTLQRQTSKENETPSSAPVQSPLVLSHQREQYHSMPHDMKLWSGGLKLPHEHQFAEFIENLGSGQLVGRQVLASPCHGEIQVGLRDQHGLLEVEIVRARNLLQKALYKMPPAPYVKVYLLDGKTCVEKQRTRTTRRTLDPLIQQTLIFKENYRDKVLQIGVWGDYGKLDRKVFMGVCQINLEDLRLSTAAQVLDWYRLFSANSLMNNYTIVQQSPKRNTSMTSHDSFSSFKTNSRS
jgi:regulating synaptic membrane exocytosis protein 2